jgi:hypothetical protein
MLGNAKDFGIVEPGLLARTSLDDFGTGAQTTNGALETAISMKFLLEGICVPF